MPDHILVPVSVVAAAFGAVLMVVAAAAPATTAAAPVPSTTSTTTTVVAATTTTVAPPTTTSIPTTTTEPLPPPPEPAPPPDPTAIELVVAFARAQLGRPYRKGAAGPDAFDCSGLVRAAYLTIGIDLPQYSVTQAGLGRAVDWRTEPVQSGDLVFTRGDTPVVDLGHVGLAISGTEWIVASRPGVPVRIAPIPVGGIQRVRRMVDA
ncbi:MAG TPA: NlpC/P60 family protein [Acidimicrobiales bacterium]|nr:NlpC/P60 family protein [Acidimicrobiales bacterium]